MYIIIVSVCLYNGDTRTVPSCNRYTVTNKDILEGNYSIIIFTTFL